MFPLIPCAGGIFGDIGDAISSAASYVGDAIVTGLSNFFGWLCYITVAALCYLVKLAYSFFSVFSGTRTVEYDGSNQFLMNIFFGNETVRDIYWGMALIGFLFIIVFTIIAVVKKTFDVNGRQQRTMGNILGGAAKSALMILLLSVVMSAVLNLTNILVDRVNYIFDNAGTLHMKNEMDFTNEQYATMARVYNTIGNYSINESYNSRYNLNSCYNAIRPDLLILQKQGVFDFYYDDSDGPTWQSELQKLVTARDPAYEIMLDDKNTVPAILEIMETLRTNKSFFPISHVERLRAAKDGETVSLDRIVFLMGTLNAANNSEFNKNPSVQDALRGPFYYGQRNIYDYDAVKEAFDTTFSGISYLIIALLACLTAKDLAVCVFNCIARIFNLIGLYIIAPLIFGVIPLDDGAKFRQWLTASVVQMFGIFGCLIPMRLMLMFIPIILDGKLVLFPESAVLDMLAKAMLLLGMIETSNRFSGIITGILAEQAGYEAIKAGDMSGFVNQKIGQAGALVKKTAGVAADVTGLSYVGNKIGGAASSAYNYIKEHGGVVGSLGVGGVNLYKRMRGSNAKPGPMSTSLKYEYPKNNQDGNKPLPPNLNKKN